MRTITVSLLLSGIAVWAWAEASCTVFPLYRAAAAGGGNAGASTGYFGGYGGQAGGGGDASSGTSSGGIACLEPPPPMTSIGTCSTNVGGLYCGGNQVDGDPDKLYLCDHKNGKLWLEKVCDGMCKPEADKLQDHCIGGAAKSIAEKHLGRAAPARFLAGLGADLAVPDSLQASAYAIKGLDIHDVELRETTAEGSWSTWAPGGGCFVDQSAHLADLDGMVPMFTLSTLSARVDEAGAAAAVALLQNNEFMNQYWADAVLLLNRIAIFDKPAILHVEPHLWAAASKLAALNDPKDIHLIYLPVECASWAYLDFVGFSNCWQHLAHFYAPKAVVGFPVWDAPEAKEFLTETNALQADLLVVESFEGFQQHLDWAKSLSAPPPEGLGRPLLWWRLPLGAAKDVLAQAAEFAASGGIGAVFGRGDDQPGVDMDGGKFSAALAQYAKAPALLP